jgi:hypothetical protein
MSSQYEVTFSVGGDTQLRNITQTVQAQHPQQARALIEAQYPTAEVQSVFQKN